MNKLLIVLLAVCLVSTHAFVKRDAPAATNNVEAQIKAMQEKLTELGKNFSENISKTLDPETVKKNFNDFIDAATKAVNNLKPAASTEAKPAA